ncbi:MAG TPA: HAD family phosphatase [Spirochaetia bacterium]|nr:HAD family phosphatase [Spirochaetia bacterium]
MNRETLLIMFDYGNVLALHDRLEICQRFAKHSRCSAHEIASRIFNTEIEYDSESGRYDSHEHFRRVKAAVEGDERWAYEEFVDEYKNVFTLNEEAVRALSYAAQRARVYILSNTTYLHSLWLFEQEILATLPESYIFSFKVGVMKPDPEIWRIAIDRAGVSPRMCLYVDDLQPYCAAAEALGIASIHYRRGVTDLLGEIGKWAEAAAPTAVRGF